MELSTQRTSQSPLKIGLVGLGRRGNAHGNYLQNIQVDEIDHEIAAGADVSTDARESFATEYDADVYETHDEMYDDAAVDAVVISVPNKFHEPAVVDALEADIPVLVEKPLAHSLESAHRIRDANADSSAFCMVGYHYRYSTGATLLKMLYDKDRFGEITHIDASYLRRRGIPAVGSWFTNRDTAGGGALMDIGVHILDLALYLMEYPEIESVTGKARSNFGHREEYADPNNWGGLWQADSDMFDVDDSANAMIHCANGATISLDVGWAANRPSNHELQVRGTDAGAHFSLGNSSIDVFEAAADELDYYRDIELSSDDRNASQEQMEAFLRSIVEEEPPEHNTINEALTMHRILDAIYADDTVRKF